MNPMEKELKYKSLNETGEILSSFIRSTMRAFLFDTPKALGIPAPIHTKYSEQLEYWWKVMKKQEDPADLFYVAWYTKHKIENAYAEASREDGRNVSWMDAESIMPVELMDLVMGLQLVMTAYLNRIKELGLNI